MAKPERYAHRTPLGTEAVRRGKIYCAPFCGRGCTWAEHMAAIAGAKRLVAMLGSNFVPRVHENMGWHFHARSVDGRLSVYDYGGGTYSALLGYEPDRGAQWSADDHRTPLDAVRSVIDQAIRSRDSLSGMLDLVLSGMIGGGHG